MPEPSPPSMGSFMYRLAARLRAHHRSRTLGQSLVEFALVLPVFLLFFAAALDLGRVFYANITLNNAAREGAFQAAITPAPLHRRISPATRPRTGSSAGSRTRRPGR